MTRAQIREYPYYSSEDLKPLYVAISSIFYSLLKLTFENSKFRYVINTMNHDMHDTSTYYEYTFEFCPPLVSALTIHYNVKASVQCSSVWLPESRSIIRGRQMTDPRFLIPSVRIWD